MDNIRISVEELRNGDIIAEEVFIENSNISLVVKDTVVDKKVRSRLENLDVGKVLINRREDEKTSSTNNVEGTHHIKKIEFKEKYKSKVSDVEDFFKGVLNEGKIDLAKVSSVSDDIFKDSDNIYMAIESINELKDFDDYTYIHSVNVAFYSMLLGQWLELEKSVIKDLVTSAILHDIGKGKVDDSILNKPGELTYEEFTEMKNHPQYGYDVCKNHPDLNDRVKEAILSHHEKMDGSGYPNGKKDSEISLFSRIIGICDVYDAITSKKVYRDKITPFETFDEIMEEGYGKFDMDIMLTFFNNIGSLYVGSSVKMNTGEIGEIVYIPPRDLSKPLIKVGEKFIDMSKNHDYKIKEIV